MPATVTTLDREIAREERCVGLPTDQPITDADIARRRIQIAFVLSACAFVAVCAVFASSGVLQMSGIVIAGGFGFYAIEQDRHLRRLARLCGDSMRITLYVAGELMYSGALNRNRELLELRDRVGRSSGAFAAALAELLPVSCARVRVVGPSGEMPIAAERTVGRGGAVPDDASPGAAAVRRHAPVRTVVGGRAVLAVPIWFGDEAVGVLEAVAPASTAYEPVDTALVDAFGCGALAALRASG
jgi:hypothetical protein